MLCWQRRGVFCWTSEMPSQNDVEMPLRTSLNMEGMFHRLWYSSNDPALCGVPVFVIVHFRDGTTVVLMFPSCSLHNPGLLSYRSSTISLFKSTDKSTSRACTRTTKPQQQPWHPVMSFVWLCLRYLPRRTKRQSWGTSSRFPKHNQKYSLPILTPIRYHVTWITIAKLTWILFLGRQTLHPLIRSRRCRRRPTSPRIHNR